MNDKRGFILLTVLIVLFVLSSLGILRMTLSASRMVDVLRFESDLQLLSLAETGISRAQALAADTAGLTAQCNREFSLGNGTYIIEADMIGMVKIVTASSYIPDKEHVKLMKTIVVEGASITSNYVWREL